MISTKVAVDMFVNLSYHSNKILSTKKLREEEAVEELVVTSDFDECWISG